MAEVPKWQIEEIKRDFDVARPFDDLDKEDFPDLSSAWEGRWDTRKEVRDAGFVYFKHNPCGFILRQGSVMIGPRGIMRLIKEHEESCPAKTANQTPAA